jgi:hypothetical protein
MTNQQRDEFDCDIDREAAYEALKKWADGGVALHEEDRMTDEETGRVYAVFSNSGNGYVVMRRDPNGEPRLLAASSGAAPSSYLADIHRDMRWRRRDLHDGK